MLKKENEVVKEAIEKGVFPYFISHEYNRFYELVKRGQYAGAWFELRDIAELIIKFPVFLGFSCLFYEDLNLEDMRIRGIVKDLLSKSLSLGKWKEFLVKLLGYDVLKKDMPEVYHILKVVGRFVSDYRIVEWRNDMIGHGALPFEDSDDFIYDMRRLSRGIDECLEETIEDYEKIVLRQEENVVAEISGKRICLERYIFEKEFFFDKFNSLNYNVHSLNYMNGKHLDIDNAWYRDVVKKKEIADELERYRKVQLDTRWKWEDVMNLQRLNKPEMYQDNKKLMKWLNRVMEEEPKGVFLLTMDRGMGKTAFVSSLNQLLADKYEEKLYIRAYYCSALKYRSMEEFVTEFNSLFKMEKCSGQTTVGKESRQLKWLDGKKEMAECLEDVLQCVRKERQNEALKLLFIIDGIDEIYEEGNKKNIFDFIPLRDQLAEGVYILLTSRNGDTESLSDFTQGKLAQLRKESVCAECNFTLKNNSDKKLYGRMLRSYFTEACKNSGVEGVPEEEKEAVLKKMCEEAKYRFVDFRLYVTLFKEAVKNHRNIWTIFDEKDGRKAFFAYMRQVLGEKVYHKAGRILLIIATAYCPLTVKDCVFLEEMETGGNITEILAILQMFESLLVYKRTGIAEINNHTIAECKNEKYQEAIVQEFGGLMDELVEEWIGFIESQYRNYFLPQGKYDPKIDYDFSTIYLYGNIYRYVTEKDVSRKNVGRIYRREFAEAIFQYEKFMPTQEIGWYVKDLDIAMSDACIEILKKQNAKDDMLLVAAYNNYIFHKKDIYRQTWGCGSTDSRAMKEKKEILDYFEEGIQILEAMERKETKALELQSKFCSLKGIFLLEQKGSLEEVEELFMQSYRLTEEILDTDFIAGCNLYEQAAERLLVIFEKERAVEKIAEKYDEIAEKMTWIKKQEEAEPYLLVNTRNRIEYGILPREAMFYRKLGTVCRKVGWEPKGRTIRDLYETSLEILRGIKEKDIGEQHGRVISDYIRIVTNEYGQYEQERQNLQKARELYDESTALAEQLIKINNFKVNRYIIETSLNYIILSQELGVHEREKMEERLKMNEKWIEKEFPQDQELKMLLDRVKESLS